MQHYVYLLVNFLTVIVCFVFSFHPKIKFYLYFRAFAKASLLVAVFFILWDVWFTRTGVWWFNERYILGIYFFHLPLEEVLFFICIPFSCIFTYFCMDRFLRIRVSERIERLVVFFSMFFSLLICSLYPGRLYTLVTFCTTFFTLGMLYFVLRVNWIGKASLVYSILMIGFFIVNGVLTGTGLTEPIVNYNPEELLNVRLLTIPVEDAVYGYEMFLWNVFFFLYFSKSLKDRRRAQKSSTSEAHG